MPFLSKVLLLFIGAVLGVFGSVAFLWYQNQTKYLTYSTYSSNALLSPIYKATTETDSVKLTINNRKLSNISQFDVLITNLGDTDLSDVEIYIELFSDRPLNVISPNYFDHNYSKEGIQPIQGLKPTHNYGMRYGYRITTFNRRKDFRGSPVFKFLLEGDIVPNVVVQTNKAGVEIKEYQIVNERGFTLEKLLAMIGLITATIIALFTVTDILKVMKKRGKEKKMTEAEVEG